VDSREKNKTEKFAADVEEPPGLQLKPQPVAVF